mmetsp:Transcript_14163/g.28252  ORF Transcript_14163/g.28252 Transcript_14163/m.28252 type:complete len:316 (-) Transcript_14163:633-1580(-)
MPTQRSLTFALLGLLSELLSESTTQSMCPPFSAAASAAAVFAAADASAAAASFLRAVFAASKVRTWVGDNPVALSPSSKLTLYETLRLPSSSPESSSSSSSSFSLSTSVIVAGNHLPARPLKSASTFSPSLITFSASSFSSCSFFSVFAVSASSFASSTFLASSSALIVFAFSFSSSASFLAFSSAFFAATTSASLFFLPASSAFSAFVLLSALPRRRAQRSPATLATLFACAFCRRFSSASMSAPPTSPLLDTYTDACCRCLACARPPWPCRGALKRSKARRWPGGGSEGSSTSRLTVKDRPKRTPDTDPPAHN